MTTKTNTILITGGTGSLGNAIVEYLLAYRRETIKKIIILSRDEQKQYKMALRYPEHEYPELRFFVGDVRDVARLRMAFQGVGIS